MLRSTLVFAVLGCLTLLGCAPATNSAAQTPVNPAAPETTARSPASNAAGGPAQTKGAASGSTVAAASVARASSSPISKDSGTMQTATFGAGCFWGVEYIFAEQPGVIEAVSGYSGGDLDNPSYEDVCAHTTKHVEVVQVTFDPTRITFEQLLSDFFRLHDPTQVNGQGPDIGNQYRSVVFAHNAEQEAAAKKMIAEINASKVFRRPVATSVEPFKKFWKAEDYHQKHYVKKGGTPYCHILRPELAMPGK
ncbi:hypothetical protein BH11PLA1_BH11PLA1_08560 [soil metagenome]